MKKIVLLTAGLALAATSAASVAQSAGSVATSSATAAQTAGATASSAVPTPDAAAKALSVKQSAFYPRRAPAKGERADGGSTALIVGLVVAVGGGVALLASSGGSDSR